MIGPQWENSENENGVRRLDPPEDWVRFEIAKVLELNAKVISSLFIQISRAPAVLKK